LPMCPTSAPINADRSRLCCSPGPARCSLRPSRARRAYARRPGRGDRLPPERAAALAPRLVEALDHPDHRSLHARRDLSADVHRSAYVQSFRSVDGVDDALASARHNRGVAPEIWRALPDVPKALSRIASRGIAIGVISNVPWDLRPIFERHGLGSLVRAFVPVVRGEDGEARPRHLPDGVPAPRRNPGGDAQGW
jgi:phosphoglycolate phosphatase-like HAD superfamily hydrolase